MTCHDFSEELANEQQPTPEMQGHSQTCAGCRAMLQSLAADLAPPDWQRVRQTIDQVTASLHPVRALPSDRMLVLLSFLGFLAFSLLGALPFGYQGMHSLSPMVRFCYYLPIALFALLFSAALVSDIIPGSRRRVATVPLICGALLALSVIAPALFPRFRMEHFVHSGIPCLRLGLICAAASGSLAYWLTRRGYPTAPVQTSLTIGNFAGLSGFAVLALHCPIQNAGHILVWHLGAVLISGIAGVALGLFWQMRTR